MARYNDQTAYPVKATPAGTDTTHVVDEADGARPNVTVTLESTWDAAAAADKNLQSAARPSLTGVDLVWSQSNGLLELTGIHSVNGSISTLRDVGTQTTNLETVFGSVANTSAEGNDSRIVNADAHTALTDNPHGVTAAQAGADPAGSAAGVQSNLDAHTGDAAIHRSLTVNEHAAITGAPSPSGSNVFTTNNDLTAAKAGAPLISTEDTLAGQMQMAVVTTLPGTPDANTLYFVTS